MIRVIRLGVLTLASLAVSSAVLAQAPPNVVLIYADDLGWGDVGFNGRKTWSTPNLDRLAREGMTLRRFYTAAVVCAPSRAAMLTGKSTIHCGVSRNDADLPAEQVTIAEALKTRGYDTALFGKWHHGKPVTNKQSYVHPMDQGFDRFFGFVDATHAWEKFPTMLWEGRERKPVSGHSDDLFSDRAIAFLHERHERPFFLYLPYISAHFNIEAPADEIAIHRGKFRERDPNQPLYATYAAMVTRFDRNVGRVLAALDETRLSQNTLVIFASDHGATFESGNLGTSNFHDSNAPFRGQKRTLWEGGVRVAAAIRWPGHIPAGSASDEPMSTLDFMPTILAATGAVPDPSLALDGVNLLPAWSGREKVPDRTLFWEWRSEGSNQLAALRGDLKLVVTNGGTPELFDVAHDPAERRNVAAAHPDAVKSLRQALKNWLATEVGKD